MMSRRLITLVLLTLAVVGVNATAATATSTPPIHGRIGPNQIFVGLVNGSSGVRSHAQIRVACPGPVMPGETTHPLAHQPLEVDPPATIDTNVGHTGGLATPVSYT